MTSNKPFLNGRSSHATKLSLGTLPTQLPKSQEDNFKTLSTNFGKDFSQTAGNTQQRYCSSFRVRKELKNQADPKSQTFTEAEIRKATRNIFVPFLNERNKMGQLQRADKSLQALCAENRPQRNISRVRADYKDYLKAKWSQKYFDPKDDDRIRKKNKLFLYGRLSNIKLSDMFYSSDILEDCTYPMPECQNKEIEPPNCDIQQFEDNQENYENREYSSSSRKSPTNKGLNSKEKASGRQVSTHFQTTESLPFYSTRMYEPSKRRRIHPTLDIQRATWTIDQEKRRIISKSRDPHLLLNSLQRREGRKIKVEPITKMSLTFQSTSQRKLTEELNAVGIDTSKKSQKGSFIVKNHSDRCKSLERFRKPLQKQNSDTIEDFEFAEGAEETQVFDSFKGRKRQRTMSPAKRSTSPVKTAQQAQPAENRLFAEFVKKFGPRKGKGKKFQREDENLGDSNGNEVDKLMPVVQPRENIHADIYFLTKRFQLSEDMRKSLNGYQCCPSVDKNMTEKTLFTPVDDMYSKFKKSQEAGKLRFDLHNQQMM